MTTAVGVTGHRALARVDLVAAGVDAAIARLDRVAPGPWTAVSALAEGADRLVAERLMARPGTRLVAVLPLEPAEYERDFAEAGSRSAFRRLLAAAAEVEVVPPREDRDAAYEAAGVGVLERSDILIAVWDGARARGRGGTGAIVSEARRRRMPLAWVHAAAAGDRDAAVVTWERLRGDEGGPA